MRLLRWRILIQIRVRTVHFLRFSLMPSALFDQDRLKVPAIIRIQFQGAIQSADEQCLLLVLLQSVANE